MTKLIYITHPAVVIDPNIPIDEWELSEEGLVAVDRLLQLDFWQEVKYLYTSEEKKAYKVGEAVEVKFGLQFEKIKDLGEADRSSTGIISPVEEYMKVVQEAYKNLALGVRGWESHLEMMLRNAKVIDQLKQKHQGETLAIIGHGGSGTTLKCYIKKVLPAFAEDPQKTGCYFVADLDQGEILADWEKY